MRVLQISSMFSSAGGVERYLQDLLPALADAGIENAVAYGCHSGDEPKVPWPVRYVRELVASQPGSRGIDSRWRRVEAMVDELRPDVVMLHTFSDPDILERLSRIVPVVQLVHGQFPLACPGDSRFLRDRREVCTRAVGPFCAVAPLLQNCGARRPWVQVPRYLMARRYQRAALRLRRIVVASRYMRDELAASGVPRERIEVIPLPAQRPARRLLPLARDIDPSTERTPPVVLFVGRLVEHKGGDALLAAMDHVTTPAHVVFVGDGSDRARLEALARSVPTRHRVTFEGWLAGERLESRYAEAALVAVPSLWLEPFGLVGLEAMAHAKPVVAFDRGGISEWLSNGETGTLVSGGDVRAFGVAIDALLRDPARARAMGATGQARLARDFTVGKHVAALVKVYEEAVKRP